VKLTGQYQEIKKDNIKKSKRTISRNQKDNIKKSKSAESDYNESANIIENGRMILGLQMTSKVFTLFVLWNLVNFIYFFFGMKVRENNYLYVLFPSFFLEV